MNSKQPNTSCPVQPQLAAVAAACIAGDREGTLSGQEQWSRMQLQAMDFGDIRRHARFLAVLSSMAQSPSEPLPAQCHGTAELKAAYRAINHPKASAAHLITSHAAATLAHVERQPTQETVILAVQDTTTLNFTTHKALDGQGPNHLNWPWSFKGTPQEGRHFLSPV